MLLTDQQIEFLKELDALLKKYNAELFGYDDDQVGVRVCSTEIFIADQKAGGCEAPIENFPEGVEI